MRFLLSFEDAAAARQDRLLPNVSLEGRAETLADEPEREKVLA